MVQQTSMLQTLLPPKEKQSIFQCIYLYFLLFKEKKEKKKKDELAFSFDHLIMKVIEMADTDLKD